jgi:peptide/nickel transport system permease protein
MSAAEAGGVGPTGYVGPIAGVAIEDPTKPQKKGLGIGAWLAIGWLGLIVGLAVLAPVLPIDNPNESFGEIARQGPLAEGHILGGDGIGRDMLSRTIHGARSSLLIGTASVLIGLVVGGLAGLIAGYFRGRLDTVLTGTFDILLAFPSLVLALSLVSFLRAEPEAGTKGLDTEQIVIIALGIVSIPILARITRANTLTWAQREFVLAARAQGAKHSRILFREVLPNVLPAMFSIALLGIAVAIIAEGGLSLLGVGVELPKPSWGNMIAEGRGSLRNSPHIVFIPSIAIFLTVLALNYMGDVIRTRFDVRESAL